jgi:tetratricopeptide (TPR) repeat protein
MAGFDALGASPLFDLWKTTMKRVEFGSTTLYAASNKVVRRMDSRPLHRWLLARVADEGLYDMPLLEEALSSLVAVAPRRWSTAETWHAALADDRARMKALADDPAVRVHRRAWLVGKLAKRGALTEREADERFQAVLASRPDDWDARDEYVDYLRGRRRYATARQVIGEWLSACEQTAHGLDALAARSELAEMHARERDHAAALAVLEPIADSMYGAAMGELALQYCGLGRHAEAEAEVRQRLARYPDDVHNVALLARVVWCAGRTAEAGALLAQPPIPLRGIECKTRIGKAFVEFFRDRPDESAMDAFEALWQAQVPPECLEGIAEAVQGDHRLRLAFDMLSRMELGDHYKVYIAAHAYRLTEALDGQPKALVWLFDRLTTAERTTLLPVMAYMQDADRLLWTAVPEPRGSGSEADYTWLLRAAAATRGKVGPERQRALEAHYRGTGATRYHTIGRYLFGQADLRDVLLLGSSPRRATEVAYFVGLKAQAEGRCRDASDWYRVTLELGQARSAEFTWARWALERWREAGRYLCDRAEP